MHLERKYFGCVERPKSPHVLSSASDWLFMAKGNEWSLQGAILMGIHSRAINYDSV